MRLFIAPDLAGEPDATIVGLWVSIPFPFRAHDRHFVIAEDMTSAPAGTFDLGDPLDAVTMATVLTPPEANGLASALDEPNGTYNGMTRSEAFNVILDHSSGWRAAQSRFVNVPLTVDIIGNIFRQTKPVL